MRAKCREELRLRIQEIFDESNQVFGAAKIAAVMKSEGFKISNEMCAHLCVIWVWSVYGKVPRNYTRTRGVNIKNHH